MDATRLDQAMRSISYESLLLLKLFQETGSFARVAQKLGVKDARPIRQVLVNDLNAVFRSGGEPLIVQKNAKVWELTCFGTNLAARAESVLTTMRAAVELSRPTCQVPLVFSSDCANYVRQLQDQTAGTEYSLRLQLEASADISIQTLLGDYPFAFFSVLLPFADLPSEPRPRQPWKGRLFDAIEVQLLPLSVQDIQLLSSRRLRMGRSVTMAQVIEKGAVVLVGRGGVARQYLDATYPNLEVLRPAQLSRIHDFHAGTQLLKEGLVDNAVMIVHGQTEQSIADFGDVTLSTLIEEDGNEKQWRAVTALVRVERSAFTTPEIEAIWDSALSLWGTPVRLVEVG